MGCSRWQDGDNAMVVPRQGDYRMLKLSDGHRWPPCGYRVGRGGVANQKGGRMMCAGDCAADTRGVAFLSRSELLATVEGTDAAAR